MAVPKKRTTKSRQNKRRQNIFLKKPNLSKCTKCDDFVLPHTLCSSCGHYKGREVVDVLAKLDKKERKQKEKEIKVKEGAEKEGQKRRPLDWRNLSRK